MQAKGIQDDSDFDEYDFGPSLSQPKDDPEKRVRKRFRTKHARMYPELYRSDVSIHPSYTELQNLSYHVVCRRRIQKLKKTIARQLNREIMHIAMMQMFALDNVRIDRIFCVGMSPKMMIVPDFANDKERRRINALLLDV